MEGYKSQACADLAPFALRSLWHSRKLAAPEEFATQTVHELASKQPAYHKCARPVCSFVLVELSLTSSHCRFVQQAPDGRDTLFIAAHTKRIVAPQAWDLEKSQKFIWELIDHCTKPQVRALPPPRLRTAARDC